MPELISKIPQQFMEFWNNLDKGNKIKTIIISAVVFLSVVTAIIIFTRPQYQTLVDSPEPRDAKEVIDQLEKERINYRLDEDGSILVRDTDKNKAQAALVQAGLPKGSVSFDDYNKTSLGTTDADRRRRYKEYKERDLTATLKEMDNVRNAVVKLSLPEKSVFFGAEEEKAKASVIIDSYYELTQQQIKGIENFIAGSVEGLSPENVSIVDSNANILNGDDESLVGKVDKNYELRQAVNRAVEGQVRDLLSALADDVKVAANLNLDFDTLVTSKEIYEPVIDGQGIIRSKEVSKESVTNGQSGGAPGTDSNLPTYPNEGNEQTGEYKSSNEIVNYEVNKTIMQSTKEIGKIDNENSSIAVALYYRPTTSGQVGNNAANVAQPIADINKIKETVSSATGIPVQNVSVNTYDLLDFKDPNPPMTLAQITETYGPIALIIILLGLIAAAILMINRQRVAQQQVQTAAPFGAVPNAEDMLPEIDLEEKSEVKKQIEKFVKQKPEAVAQLLRNWLAEEWD